MNRSKEVVSLIKYFPKREALIGTVKNYNTVIKYVAGFDKFSATRLERRAKCFMGMLKNYAFLQETWKECLQLLD